MLLKYAPVPAGKQAKRTDVRVRRFGLVGLTTLALSAIVMASASSALASPLPLIALGNYTASDKGVSYAVDFVSTKALKSGKATITLQAPSGTSFGNCEVNTCKVIDEPAKGSATPGIVNTSALTNGGATITLTTPVAVKAGDNVVVRIPENNNTNETGEQTLEISTSKDKTPVHVTFYLSPRVVISQVRPNGPNGSEDGYVELYAGGPAVSLENWTLQSVSNTGAVHQTLVAFKKGQEINDNGALPDGFLLAAGATYKTDALNKYAKANYTFAAGTAIPPNGAVALYDNTGKLVDSVVFAPVTENNTGIVSDGSLGEYTANNEQYAFVRKLAEQPDQLSGAPLYTGHNASDFTLVAPETANPLAPPSPFGTGTALTAFEGAPGPHDLASPVIENPNLTVSLLKGTNPNAEPNLQVVPATLGTPTAHSLETIYLRRTVTYDGQCTLGNIRFRVSDITTDSHPGPATGQAILRVLSNTSPSHKAVALTLDPPSVGEDGGGVNASLSPPPGTELSKGESFNVEFKLGVQQHGSYRFHFNVEGNTVGSCH